MEARPTSLPRLTKLKICCQTADSHFILFYPINIFIQPFWHRHETYNQQTTKGRIMRDSKKRDEDEEEHLAQTEHGRQDKQQVESEAITYGQNPVHMRCPYCLELIRSEIILKPQIITVALGMCIFAIVPNFVMMLLIIMLLQFASSRKHRCPLCERQLGSDGKFLIYFTDEVYSVSFLSAGLIFTKKTLATILLIAFAASVISIRSYYQIANKFVATTWAEYVSECGSSDGNVCLQKYRDKQFQNWQGYLLKIQDNRQYQHKWYLHALSLYMKMDPTLHNDTKPDILLTLNSDVLFSHSELASDLVHGDKIRFNCTLHDRERGSLKDVLHFHVDKMEKVGHDSKYAMFVSEIEEEWIKIHVEDKGNMRSEPDPSAKIEPI